MLVASKLREMYEGDEKGKTATEAVLAAERVGCGLERVLLGWALGVDSRSSMDCQSISYIFLSVFAVLTGIQDLCRILVL